MLYRSTVALGFVAALLSGTAAKAEYDRNLGTIYHPAPQPPVEEAAAPATPEKPAVPEPKLHRKRSRIAAKTPSAIPLPPSKSAELQPAAEGQDPKAAPKAAVSDARENLSPKMSASTPTTPAAETVIARGPVEDTPSPTPASSKGAEVAPSPEPSRDGPHEQPAPTLHDLVTRHAKLNGVPSALAAAVVEIESRFNPKARGGGALGLMQIRYETARSAGFAGSAVALFEPETNVRFGMKVLADAYKSAHGDVCMALAKYQSGHLTTRMSAANRTYCARAKSLMARS